MKTIKNVQFFTSFRKYVRFCVCVCDMEGIKKLSHRFLEKKSRSSSASILNTLERCLLNGYLLFKTDHPEREVTKVSTAFNVLSLYSILTKRQQISLRYPSLHSTYLEVQTSLRFFNLHKNINKLFIDKQNKRLLKSKYILQTGMSCYSILQCAG